MRAHPHLIQIKRISELGRLGEMLAAERLAAHGFTEIEDLNARRHNYPFADLLAEKEGVRFLIGVKTRNEMRRGNVGPNESYNLVLIPDAMNSVLKEQGKTAQQITGMLLAEVGEMAHAHDAVPAWATVSVRPTESTFSAYFGLVSHLGNRRSVPMTPKAYEGYLCLGRNIADSRIASDLLNV